MPQFNFDQIFPRRGFDGYKWNLYPQDILPMWVADSDFKSPQQVIDALANRVEHGIFGYTLPNDLAFGEAAARWVKVRFGWEANPAWVEYSPGVCAALSLCVNAFSNPGDDVVMLTPVYPPFFTTVSNNGRNPISSSLLLQKGSYEIDFEDLEKKLARPRARMLFLCNPHNPTGRVFTQAELLAIGELCLKHKIIVISDEIHCDYVYAGHKHIPFPSLSKELAEISLVAISPSKTFNIADMHTAAVLSASPSLLARYRAASSNANLGRHSLGIIAFTTAYNQCDAYADAVLRYVHANLEFAVSYIKEHIPEINSYMPQSTYLLWLNCSGLGFASQDDLLNFFLKEAKVALNSGTDYGVEGKQFMRINLACPRKLVEEGLSRIAKAVRAKYK